MSEKIGDRLAAAEAPRHWEIPGNQLVLPGDRNDHAESMRTLRYLLHAERIRKAMESGQAPVPQSTRGKPRAVVCLTLIDPVTGKPKRYASARAAGAPLGLRGHHISRAIRLGWFARKHRFAWADEYQARPHGRVQFEQGDRSSLSSPQSVASIAASN